VNVRFRGNADMGRGIVPIISDAIDPEATIRPAGWLQKSSLCSLWPLIDCCQFYIL
jgi:hypothetical protein